MNLPRPRFTLRSLFGYLSHSHAQTFFAPANSVYPWINIQNIYIQNAYLFSVDCLVYTPPQILVAWLAGRTLARFKQV